MAAKILIAALSGAALGAGFVTYIVRRYLPEIIREHQSDLGEHERDMFNFYESLAKDKSVFPLRTSKNFLRTLCLYDPTDPTMPSQIALAHMKKNVDCLFARGSKMWSNPAWNDMLTLEENVLQCKQAFTLFISLQRGIDGFVFDLPAEFGSSIEVFGETVRRVLTALSDVDPARYNCMEKSFIGRKGWVFRFNDEEAFVTTFAPCYPETHSRYNFGLKSCQIVFQPYSSFLHNNVGNDTPHTNWENPQTMRDKIRIKFRDSGRPYLIRDTIVYPIVEEIVRPLDTFGPPLVWWEKKKIDENSSTATATATGGGERKKECPFLAAAAAATEEGEEESEEDEEEKPAAGLSDSAVLV